MSEKNYSEEKLKEFKTIIEPELERTKVAIENLSQMRKRRHDHFPDKNLDLDEESERLRQHGRNKASMRRLKTKSKRLQAALARIENGTYGIDEKTGKLIDEERLKAMPTAVYEI